MTTLFVSDVHLHPGRPEASDCFLRFLASEAASAERLYILGDLFETWIGDDAADDHEREVISALATLTARGVPVGLIRGNRDFLLGSGFERKTGVRLLPDEIVIQVAGQPVLLMHGDTLCTDDHAYQRYRSVVRRPLIVGAFRALPRASRQWIANRTRARSRTAIAMKPATIMDVNQAAVGDAMRRHGVTVLVHGHTHRPAVHRFDIDGVPATRIVLGDWHEQGSVLRWAGPEPVLSSLAWSRNRESRPAAPPSS